jgi:hypothetical protein
MKFLPLPDCVLAATIVQRRSLSIVMGSCADAKRKPARASLRKQRNRGRQKLNSRHGCPELTLRNEGGHRLPTRGSEKHQRIHFGHCDVYVEVSLIDGSAAPCWLINKDGYSIDGMGGKSKDREELQKTSGKDVPAARARSEAKAQKMIEEMALDELRAARDLTQEHLSKILGVLQAAVSKLERRTDMYISTLADFIRAMGGTLEICAIFPDGNVRIKQFGKLVKTA